MAEYAHRTHQILKQQGKKSKFVAQKKYIKFDETHARLAKRARAERAIRNLYRLRGHAPPKYIAWCSSPVSLYLVFHFLYLKNGKRLFSPISSSDLFLQLPSGISKSAAKTIYDIGENRKKEKSMDCLGQLLPDCSIQNIKRLFEIPRSTGKSMLRNCTEAEFKRTLQSCLSKAFEGIPSALIDDYYRRIVSRFIKTLGIPLNTYGAGQLDTEWILRILIPCISKPNSSRKHTQTLRVVQELSRSCSWYLPCEKVCLVSDRYEHRRFNKQNGWLPYETVFRDGWIVTVDPEKCRQRKIYLSTNI